ncbi:sugar transferase [Micromonospora sp. DT4]|uniref:sugar transferase n=1 Tax=Micromonospora sp. DT4 TaxID=3393438 RepID=UPI003CF089BE
MQPNGPYRFTHVLGGSQVGKAWAAIGGQGRLVTVAVLDAAVAATPAWREAFSATANALAQTQGGQTFAYADFGAAAPWVAYPAEAGPGAEKLFRALGVDYQPVPDVTGPNVPSATGPRTLPCPSRPGRPNRSPGCRSRSPGCPSRSPVPARRRPPWTPCSRTTDRHPATRPPPRSGGSSRHRHLRAVPASGLVSPPPPEPPSGRSPATRTRTIYIDAEERLAALRERNESDGLLFKIKDDPRVTPIGRHLRALSLDELPQPLEDGQRRAGPPGRVLIRRFPCPAATGGGLAATTRRPPYFLLPRLTISLTESRRTAS